MPRNQNNPTEFIVGALPVVVDLRTGNQYFVDGKAQQLRRCSEPTETLNMRGAEFMAYAWQIIFFEFYGQCRED